jgi:hypothetical protein
MPFKLENSIRFSIYRSVTDPVYYSVASFVTCPVYRSVYSPVYTHIDNLMHAYAA